MGAHARSAAPHTGPLTGHAHTRSAPSFSLGRQIHRRLPHRAKARQHTVSPGGCAAAQGRTHPQRRPHTGPLTGHAHTPAAPPPYGAPDGPCAHTRSAPSFSLGRQIHRRLPHRAKARQHTASPGGCAAAQGHTRPQRPHARTPAHTQLALLSALPPGRLNPHAHAPAHAHPQLRQGTPRRPDGPNRSAALPKSPFGRRARGFFFFFAVSSLLCFLLYPLFFENIRRPPLASKFVGRPLRTPLAAPRLPASLPSAPLVPRPAPAPHPAPPLSRTLFPLPTPHLPLPTPAFPTPALPRPAPLSPLPGFPLPTPHLPLLTPHLPLPTPAFPTPALPRLFHPRRTKRAHASFPMRAPFFSLFKIPSHVPPVQARGFSPGLKRGSAAHGAGAARGVCLLDGGIVLGQRL